MRSDPYDAIPYGSYSRRESHPERMAAIATLHGLPYKPIHQSRILELGCASGGNILPIADTYPSAEIIGIEISDTQVLDGQKIISDLDLANIKIIKADLAKLPPDLGKFDYIICHGVYSWVHKETQDRILRVFKSYLTDQGLGYLSFNTLPGWHMQRMLREMMMYHTRHIENPHEKVDQARALLQFLDSSRGADLLPYGDFLRENSEQFKTHPAYYVFHEYLGEHSSPCYLHQMVERLKPFDLQFVGDSNLSLATDTGLPQSSKDVLAGLQDKRIEYEQYLDFVRGRKFREMILCRAGKKIDWPPGPARIEHMHISANLTPAPSDPSRFVHQKGGEITVSAPLVKTFLRYLAEMWPGRAAWGELVAHAVSVIPAEAGSTAALAEASEILMQCYEANLIELDTAPGLFTHRLPSAPRASRLAAYQALRQESAASLKHQRVKLEGVVRKILSLCDGIRDKDAFTAELLRAYTSGELVIEGKDVTEKLIAQLVDRALDQLRVNAFFLK